MDTPLKQNFPNTMTRNTMRTILKILIYVVAMLFAALLSAGFLFGILRPMSGLNSIVAAICTGVFGLAVTILCLNAAMYASSKISS